jgi:hypothetical protein
VLALTTARRLPPPLSLQLLTVWVAPIADSAGRQNSAPMHAASGVRARWVGFMQWIMGWCSVLAIYSPPYTRKLQAKAGAGGSGFVANRADAKRASPDCGRSIVAIGDANLQSAFQRIHSLLYLASQAPRRRLLARLKNRNR